MANAKPELKAECIRLRIEERLSLREIQDRTGASKGSLSGWLKPHPLTDEERATRRRTVNRYQAPKKERGEESKHHRSVRGGDLTKNMKGKIAEAAVLFRATLNQFTVFGSPFDGDREDWVVGVGEDLWRVQVKWASRNLEGLPTVSLRRSPVSGTRRVAYKAGDFDFIVGYDLFTDTCYVWSWDEVAKHTSAVTICPEAEERWDKLRR